METLKYRDQKVYTQSNRGVDLKDLEKAVVSKGAVLDAYFFELDEKRLVRRVDFDREKIERESSGLMVDVGDSFGQGSLSIVGLERITNFLYDTKALGNLSTIKGKPVIQYATGEFGSLLGISV